MVTNKLSLNPNTNTAIVEAHPEEKMAQAKQWADTLIRTIDTTQGFVEMLGKNRYLKVEAWQLIAKFAGLSIATTTQPVIEKGEIVGYKAIARLVDMVTGEDRGAAAEQQCRLDSDVQKGQYTLDKKHTAVMGMAQTRASSRVVRENYAFVALLGGFEPLPADEITDEMRKAGSSPIVQHAQSQGANIVDVIPNTPANENIFDQEPSLNSNVSYTVSDDSFLCPLHDGETHTKKTSKAGATFWSHPDNGKWCAANEFNQNMPRPEIASAWAQNLIDEMGHDSNMLSECASKPIKDWLEFMVNAKSATMDEEWCQICGIKADVQAEDGAWYCIPHNN